MFKCTTTDDAATSSSSSEVKRAYPFDEIEAKWQLFWEENRTFRTPDGDDLDTSKPKFYVLDMFPYPRSILSFLSIFNTIVLS